MTRKSKQILGLFQNFDSNPNMNQNCLVLRGALKIIASALKRFLLFKASLLLASAEATLLTTFTENVSVPSGDFVAFFDPQPDSGTSSSSAQNRSGNGDRALGQGFMTGDKSVYIDAITLKISDVNETTNNWSTLEPGKATLVLTIYEATQNAVTNPLGNFRYDLGWFKAAADGVYLTFNFPQVKLAENTQYGFQLSWDDNTDPNEDADDNDLYVFKVYENSKGGYDAGSRFMVAHTREHYNFDIDAEIKTSDPGGNKDLHFYVHESKGLAPALYEGAHLEFKSSGAPGDVRFTYGRSKLWNSAGLKYTVERATSLSPANWTTSGTTEFAINSINNDFDAVAVDVEAGEAGTLFCRLKIDMADFYVSSRGSDDWSGTLAEPNANQTDGPFASLKKARDAVSALLKLNTSGNILVLIRGGEYRLDETLVFDLDDSGKEDSRITYAAYPGERPVFSSGLPISGWTRAPLDLPDLPAAASGKVWFTDAPSLNEQTWRFRTLYDGLGRLPRARSEEFKTEKDGADKSTLIYPKGKLKNWSNLADVEICARPKQKWLYNILPLASVNEAKRIAETAVTASGPLVPTSGGGYWVENVLEELDEPGEWVLNTQTKKLYLWPRHASTVKAPQLVEYIRVEGDIKYHGPTDTPVRNLHFQGLTFTHGERYSLTQDDKGLQSDWDFLDKTTALVRFRGTENCSIKDSHFLHSGGGGIRIDLHGKNNTVAGNTIEYMGSTGILLCGYGPGTKDVNGHNVVYNNYVHHIGEIWWQSPGIFVWQSANNLVKNNLIHNTGYSAMVVSGMPIDWFTNESKKKRELTRTIRWNEIGGGPREIEYDDARPYLHTANNRIEYNEIHHAMQRLGDGNGIYIRGADEDNIIKRNYIHDLNGDTGAQSAIRTDGGQRGTFVIENVIYRCRSLGLKQKLNNHFVNNIVVDIYDFQNAYISLKEGPMKGATFMKNIFYDSKQKNGFDFVREGINDPRGREDALLKQMENVNYNIYYSAANPEYAKKQLEQYQSAERVDVDSRAVDPLFVDLANGDFRFQGNSPAREMKIKQIDVAEIGLRD